MDIQHPMITEIEQSGYPDMYKEKHCGIDAMGEEIMEGDAIVEIGNETVLEHNLEDFLIERLGAKFTLAK